MKTKLCRPVLVEIESTELQSLNSNRDVIILYEGVLYNPFKNKNYQLILISLDPDDKVEVNSKYIVELFSIEGKSIGFHLEKCNTINDIWVNDISVNSTRHINNCKKVIATQDQISPEYIQQFIEEYNRTGIKDIEIVMKDWCDYDDDNPCEVLDQADWRPKLTNGFITIVEKKSITLV